jgi:hypothetical protein
MAENFISEAIGDGATQGGAAFKHSIKAATDGLECARGHLDDGLDLVRGLADSANDFVARQPLVAVAAAFLIGYVAARMLRRVSS